LLTNALASVGRTILATVLRLDIGKMAGIQTRTTDARLIMLWLTRVVTNVELMTTWLILWPVLHLGTLFVRRFALGLSQTPVPVLIPVELFPALMLSLAVMRMSISISQFTRVAKAISAAREAGIPPPGWTQEPGLALRLMKPTDVDLVLVAALIAVIEILVR
jgi:hypothetical protein